MSTGGTEYSIFFAWTPPNTAWSLSLARFDEAIFDLSIEHDEAQIPTATIEVRNPRIGLINPSRQYWAWISYSRDACDAQPLFYGRLVGIPEEILANTFKMKFIARATDYAHQKQQVANSMKVLPNWDPIWFDQAKRDDPDSILEGWSALYHVDRVNLRVSASDLNLGEDGTLTFAAKDVFYDSVQIKIGQPPLKAVNVKAEVQWRQQYRDHFLVGQWAWPTLGSDAFVGDWPKSGSSLGAGWYAGISWAGERDPSPYQTPSAQLVQSPIQFSWTNQQKVHKNGDTMSISFNYTPPFGNTIVLKESQQVGIQNPFAEDQYGNPDPVNIPAKVSIDWFCYLPFTLHFKGKQSLAVLSLAYEADRQRSERLEMTVGADVQPVLIDPLVTEDTEQITLKSGDLGLPLITLFNWSSVAGNPVTLGTTIFPDNPVVPGQTSSQICTTAGTAGTTIPTFSNIAGQTTNDGSVVWTILGDTPPTEN